MFHDLVKFELLLAFLYSLGRLNIVVLHLLPMETSGLETLHRLTAFSGVQEVILNVANHSL